MKQHIFAILLFASISTIGQGNQEVQNTLTQLVDHAQEASLYRNKVDWDTLRPNIYSMAAEAETTEDLVPALNYLLASLGDEHGRVFHNNQIIAYYRSNESKKHLETYQSHIYNDVQMGQVYAFHTEMLKNKTGYIRIVGLPMGDNEKMAAEIQSGVCELIDAGAEKWILDLRYNGGGNMHPMAEGIAMIIGNGNVGGSQGLTPEESSSWKVEENHFYYDDYSVHLDADCAPKKHPKVAVLTSLYTASSGEALAVIFKGRDQTKHFGEKTHGMITVTDWLVVDEATFMTISVSYYKDRNDVVYNQFVDVDIEVPFDEVPLTSADEGIRVAMKWLNEK